MTKTKDGLQAQVTVLERRIEALEHDAFMETHTHFWRYRKTIHGENGSPFYEWECTHVRCDIGSFGTNNVAGVPDHFPERLR